MMCQDALVAPRSYSPWKQRSEFRIRPKWRLAQRCARPFPRGIDHALGVCLTPDRREVISPLRGVNCERICERLRSRPRQPIRAFGRNIAEHPTPASRGRDRRHQDSDDGSKVLRILNAAASGRTLAVRWKWQFAHSHRRLTLHTDGGDHLVHWVPAGHDCPEFGGRTTSTRLQWAASVGEPGGRDQSTEAL